MTGEILFGLGKLAQGRRRADLEAKAQKLFAFLPCEPIPQGAGDFYASLKMARQRRGLPLDENDLWMACLRPNLSDITDRIIKRLEDVKQSVRADAVRGTNSPETRTTYSVFTPRSLGAPNSFTFAPISFVDRA